MFDINHKTDINIKHTVYIYIYIYIATVYIYIRGVAVQTEPKSPHIEDPRSHKTRHTHLIELLCTIDQLVAEETTYKTRKKHRWISNL